MRPKCKDIGGIICNQQYFAFQHEPPPKKIMILVNRCKSMKWRNTKKSNCKPTPINTRQLQSFSRYFLRLRFGSPKQHKQNHLWPHIKINYSENLRNQNQSEISPNLGRRTAPFQHHLGFHCAFRCVSGCQGTMDDWGDAPRADAVGAPAAVLLARRAPPAAGCTSTDPGWPRGPQGMGWGWMAMARVRMDDLIWFDMNWCDVIMVFED